VPILWLIAGIVLIVAEMFTLDFVLVMFGGGALAAAAAGALGVDNVFVQVLIFSAVSALGLVAVRPAIKNRMHRGADPAVMGVAAIEGSEATVVEQVAADSGMVKIGGELWRARPYDMAQIIEPGARVRVVEVKGATALVWRE
jgi:membrane protein implicated in regulation of membrane protease activity